MGAFDNFPYTNIHNLNLDWILEEIRKKIEDLPEDVYTRLENAESAIEALQIAVNELTADQLKSINLLPPDSEINDYQVDTLRTIVSYLAVNHNADYLASGTVRDYGVPVKWVYSRYFGYLRQYAGADQYRPVSDDDSRYQEFRYNDVEDGQHVIYMDCSTFMSLIRKGISYTASPYSVAFNTPDTDPDKTTKIYNSGLISYQDFSKAYLSDIYGAYQTHRDAFIEHQANNRLYEISYKDGSTETINNELIGSLKTGDIIWCARTPESGDEYRFRNIYHVGYYVKTIEELDAFGLVHGQTYKASDNYDPSNGYVVSVVGQTTDPAILTINTLTYWMQSRPGGRSWERIYFNRGWSDTATDSRYKYLTDSTKDEGVKTIYTTERGNTSIIIDRSYGTIFARSVGASGLDMDDANTHPNHDFNEFVTPGIWETGSTAIYTHGPANEVASRATLICYGFNSEGTSAGTQILVYESTSTPRIYYRFRSAALEWGSWAAVGAQYQQGSVSTGSIAAGAVGSVEVTFPQAFNATPAVMVIPRGTTAWGSVSIGTPTATGFTLYVRNHGAQAFTFTVNWIAQAANRA